MGDKVRLGWIRVKAGIPGDFCTGLCDLQKEPGKTGDGLQETITFILRNLDQLLIYFSLTLLCLLVKP